MSILVATDFSPCSQTAVRLATALARQRSEPLILLHAVPYSIGYARQLPDIDLLWQSNRLTLAEAMLATAARDPREQGVQVQTEAVIGDPPGVISNRIREPEITLAVLGTHGRTGTARFFLGSVAEAAVRASTIPILVTPAHEPKTERWEGRSPFDLVVGSDGSTASRAALHWAVQFAARRPAAISVARMYWPSEEALRYGLESPWGRPRPDPELLDLVDRDLRRDLGPCPAEKVGHPRFRVAGRDAAEVLAEEALGLGADAIAVGVPQRGSSRWTFLDPTAVLRTSPVPVWCVPESVAAPDEVGAVQTVLLATDLSEASKAAILPAYRLLGAGGGRVELCMVHALGPIQAFADVPVVPPLDEARRKEIESELRALIPPDAAARGIITNLSVLEGRLVPETIIAAAERLNADVVVLGSRGRSGLTRALLGSVADEVARTSTRPVLLVQGHSGTS